MASHTVAISCRKCRAALCSLPLWSHRCNWRPESLALSCFFFFVFHKSFAMRVLQYAWIPSLVLRSMSLSQLFQLQCKRMVYYLACLPRTTAPHSVRLYIAKIHAFRFSLAVHLKKLVQQHTRSRYMLTTPLISAPAKIHATASSLPMIPFPPALIFQSFCRTFVPIFACLS